MEIHGSADLKRGDGDRRRCRSTCCPESPGTAALLQRHGSDPESEIRGNHTLTLIERDKPDVAGSPRDVQCAGDVPQIRAAQISRAQYRIELGTKRSVRKHPREVREEAIRKAEALAGAGRTQFGFKQIRCVGLPRRGDRSDGPVAGRADRDRVAAVGDRAPGFPPGTRAQRTSGETGSSMDQSEMVLSAPVALDGSAPSSSSSVSISAQRLPVLE